MSRRQGGRVAPVAFLQAQPRKALLNISARCWPGTDADRTGLAIVTKANEDHQPSSPFARRAQRLERQARVGILRNPNHPPRPPLRKAALMGKWPHLRSTRRPKADTDAARTTDLDTLDTLAAQPPTESGPSRAQASQASEVLSDIDLARQMKEARDIHKASLPRSNRPRRRQTGADNEHAGPAGSCLPLPGYAMMVQPVPGMGTPQPSSSDAHRPPAPPPAPDHISPRKTGRVAQGLFVVAGFGFLGIVALLLAGP